jgi:hypothetical protein
MMMAVPLQRIRSINFGFTSLPVSRYLITVTKTRIASPIRFIPIAFNLGITQSNIRGYVTNRFKVIQPGLGDSDEVSGYGQRGKTKVNGHYIGAHHTQAQRYPVYQCLKTGNNTLKSTVSREIARSVTASLPACLW